MITLIKLFLKEISIQSTRTKILINILIKNFMFKSIKTSIKILSKAIASKNQNFLNNMNRNSPQTHQYFVN